LLDAAILSRTGRSPSERGRRKTHQRWRCSSEKRTSHTASGAVRVGCLRRLLRIGSTRQILARFRVTSPAQVETVTPGVLLRGRTLRLWSLTLASRSVLAELGEAPLIVHLADLPVDPRGSGAISRARLCLRSLRHTARSKCSPERCKRARSFEPAVWRQRSFGRIVQPAITVLVADLSTAHAQRWLPSSPRPRPGA
jgi:hypothetical protein